MPRINYPADDYLAVRGQVGKEVMAKLPPEEIVNLIIKTKDSTNNFYTMRPESSGLLTQSGLIFYDTARVLFSFNKNKTWNTQMAFSTSNYTSRQPVSLYNPGSYLVPDTTGYVKLNQAASLFNYYINSKANQPLSEKTLEAVSVKNRNNWRNDPVLKLDERYATGLFKGGASSEAYDILHDEMADQSRDVRSYLRYRSGILQRNADAGPPLYFIDERIADVSEVDNLWMTSIAYIKIISPYFGTRNDAGKLGPAISIYTKKGDDLIDRRPKVTDLKMVRVAGYSPIKEFYSPDYSETNTTTGTDARTTLLWLPYILTDAKTLKIPVIFYNNDFTRKMRVVLEGINEEGKMIHMEKIIE
ncbi:MAG TPA: hypothetical protein VK489_03950, partial [Ferruginibacter sp.]|nr:hypothetical protein [Ferruginibacter sp.]